MQTTDYKTLLDKVRSASSLDEGWGVVAASPVEFITGKIKESAAAGAAFELTSRFVDFEPNNQRFLETALLWSARVSLNSTADENTDTRFQIQQTREKVGDWLRSLPWHLRRQITPNIILLATQALSGSQWKQGCWLLSAIGWRNTNLEKTLWKICQKQNGIKGDLIFCTLLELGVTLKDRARYLSEAHRRYRKRPNRPNVHSIYIIGARDSLKVLSEPPENDTGDAKWVWLFLPQTIARIADVRNTEIVGSEAIDTLKMLFRGHRAKIERGVYLGGSVISRCNSRKAVRFLLELVAEERDSISAHNLMLLLRRLEECVGSNQVRAFNLSRNRAELKKLIHKILTAASDYKGRALTFEGDVKNHLWNLCLMLGTDDAPSTAYHFIQADQNPYTHFKVLSDLSCFRLDPLPSLITEWASQPESKASSISESSQVLEAMEAIRVVASAGTQQAFDVLLKSQFTTMGRTLADSADGLASVAVTLCETSDLRDYVRNELFRTLTDRPTGPQPGSVSCAIESLSRIGVLRLEDYERVVFHLLSDNDWIQETAVRARLVGALSAAPSQLLKGDLLERIRSWATLPDRMLSSSCFEVLIKQGFFEEPELRLIQKLKFSHASPSSILQSRDASDVNGGIYAMLATRFPERYEIEFGNFLRTAPLGSLIEAMTTLGRIKAKQDIQFSPTWADALLERAKGNNNRYNSEPHLFSLLREYAPSALANTDWPALFADWTPETREALATAIGKIPRDSDSNSEAAARSLVELTNDTHFSVRRAAYRALGALRSSLLCAIVAASVASESPDVRKLSAEALFWIPASLRSRRWWLHLRRKLGEDVAKDVREAVYEAEQRARKIAWAQKYHDELLAPTSGSNLDVLKRWKYSVAISRVGDDETVVSLRNHLRTTVLPANFQRFLIRSIEALENNWEKCRKKWPQPVAPGNAATSSGTGTLTFKERMVQVSYQIWQKTDILGEAGISWGGAAYTSEPLHEGLLGKAITFTDNGGHRSEVWIQKITFPKTLSFVGGNQTAEVQEEAS